MSSLGLGAAPTPSLGSPLRLRHAAQHAAAGSRGGASTPALSEVSVGLDHTSQLHKLQQSYAERLKQFGAFFTTHLMARASTRWAQEDLLALIDGAATTERLKGVFGGRVAAPWTLASGSPGVATPAPTTPAGEEG